MTRPTRVHDPETAFHVFSRGNDHQELFLADEDFEYFLSKLEKARRELGCRIFAYCLMSNHFHLLIRAEAIPLSEVMQRILTSYSRRFNLKFDRSGHVFQNRFGSIPCRSERYFLALLRYIHRNPVKAGLVSEPSEWRWSGHRELIGTSENRLVDVRQALAPFGGDPDEARSLYSSFLSTTSDSEWTVGDPWATIGPSIQAIEEIGQLVAEETGISIERMRGRSRTQVVSAARRLVAARALAAGWPGKKLAQFLDCSAAAVSKMHARNKLTPQA